MSHSDDEEDFLSADEDVECEQENRCDITANSQQGDTRVSKFNESSNTKVIQDTSNAGEIESIPGIKLEFEQKLVSTDPPSRRHIDERESQMGEPVRQDNEETTSDDDERVARQDEDEEEEDDEEAVLAERIRERNLKIARNFSVEIVKNLQASAPIPVELKSSSTRRQRYPDNTSDLNGSTNPPAPPPTPALSSSYSNQDEQFNKNTSGSPSLSTQYSWRLPPKIAASATSDTSSTETLDTLKSTTEQKEGFNVVESNPKSSEQARLALDRLSQKLSQPDKNLFERVAEDIRNMSITGDDSLIGADVTSQLNALPSTITDIGSTLGGWGWSGATKLLSSATQVTSQVGSVLNSIVDASQPRATMMPASDARNRQDLVGDTKDVKNVKSD